MFTRLIRSLALGGAATILMVAAVGAAAPGAVRGAGSLDPTALGTVPTPFTSGHAGLYAWGAATMPDGSVIPAFRGARAPEATIAAGVPWAGVTVHRVTPATDRGDVLVRTPFALAPGTTLDRFRECVRPLEHAAVAKAIRRWSLNA